MDYHHEKHNIESSKKFTELRLTDSDCLGWDLDHTIIRYNLRNLYNLINHSFLRYLVEIQNYDSSILKIPFNIDFSKKGVLIDRDAGNILLLDFKSTIVVSYHGYKRMTEEEIKKEYGAKMTIDYTGSSTFRFWSLSTYFEAPLASIFASLVDYEQNKKLAENRLPKDYRSIAESLYDAMYFNFAEWRKGWYFPEIAMHTEKYIIKQEGLLKWFENLKKVHKRFLFLLTNSLPEYTDILMSYSFGSNWPSIFDVVCVHAQKPKWFTEKDPYFAFKIVKRKRNEYPGPEYPLSKEEESELKINGLYSNGNANMLIELFKRQNYKIYGRSNEKLDVIYFGDHLRNDIQISKTFLKWKTVAIVEELEDLEIEESFKNPSGKELIKGKTNSNHTSDNKYWGSFFTTNNGNFTFWANEIIEHSDLVVPSLERLTSFPENYLFTSERAASIQLSSLVSSKKKENSK